MTRRQILTLFGMASALEVPLTAKPLSNDDKRIIDTLRNGKRVDTLRAQVATHKTLEQILGPGRSPFKDFPERMGRSARKRFDQDCIAVMTCTAINPSTNTITLE